MPPNRDVVKPKFVPPQIKHRLIETKDSFLCNSGRRRRKVSQAIVDEDSLPLVLDARYQMPQCKCVALSSLIQHNRQIPRARLSGVLKIEPR
jgi:hypothetical protein